MRSRRQTEAQLFQKPSGDVFSGWPGGDHSPFQSIYRQETPRELPGRKYLSGNADASREPAHGAFKLEGRLWRPKSDPSLCLSSDKVSRIHLFGRIRRKAEFSGGPDERGRRLDRA